MSHILPTNNETWGFFGTIHTSQNQAVAEQAWAVASETLANTTQCDPIDIRCFLDSKNGRHFADDVCNGLAEKQPLANAVDAAVTRWMAWTISPATERNEGIPAGTPYLTGWIIHAGIVSAL